jgi:hypothetical protein
MKNSFIYIYIYIYDATPGLMQITGKERDSESGLDNFGACTFLYCFVTKKIREIPLTC